MQFSTLFLAVFPALALAAPATLPKRQFPAQPNTNEDITMAAAAWFQDTFFVSTFFDYAVSTSPNPPFNLGANAAQALSAELDELNHKTILDNFFVNTTTPNPDVVNAYNVLVTQGNFQQVVIGLADIATTGNLANVMTISTNRCAFVLPAIDVYFNAVAAATGQSLPLAARPLACGGV
ncbi:uncharacterized protein PAC_12980 [Phialocephala subalpina]|uniref:Uncharacterized protein n=1 Tax=Phialocephala subalpina TaxID=576137 RepID=A0A1L7XDJ3_9HELO|nr:uncharacterized protein PAC_12980 [Phialocephala subalpina]